MFKLCNLDTILSLTGPTVECDNLQSSPASIAIEKMEKIDIGMVRSRWKWAQILEDLNVRGLSEDEILKKINNDEYGFNYYIFEDLKRNQKEQDGYITNPPIVEEGVVECLKCHSKRVLSMSVQTRSADEPMSVKAQCMECKTRWIQNC